MPDISMLPKLAIFYNVSIDYLFNLDNFKNYGDLVYKYHILHGEDNFKEAEVACISAIKADENNINAKANAMFLYENAFLDYLKKAKELCLDIPLNELTEFQKQAHLTTLLHYEFHEFKNKKNISKYKQEYELTHSSLSLIGLLACLEMEEMYEDIIMYCNNFLLKNSNDRIELYKADALYHSNQNKEAEECYRNITKYSNNDNVLYDCFYNLFLLTRNEEYRNKLLNLARNDLMKDMIMKL